MNIETEIFNRYSASQKQLLNYGFIPLDNNYYFEKNILDNSFKIVVEYKDNTINAKVIDLAFNDEYINFRNDTIGEFNHQVKTILIDLLLDIRDKCFKAELFIYPQTNFINNYLISTFSNPIFPFTKHPNFAVYKKGNKWFVTINDIPLNKLTNNTDNKIIEAMNIKINPNNRHELLKIDGIYPAYHINKNHWLTVTLDNRISNSELIKLINQSYELVK